MVTKVSNDMSAKIKEFVYSTNHVLLYDRHITYVKTLHLLPKNQYETDVNVIEAIAKVMRTVEFALCEFNQRELDKDNNMSIVPVNTSTSNVPPNTHSFNHDMASHFNYMPPNNMPSNWAGSPFNSYGNYYSTPPF